MTTLPTWWLCLTMTCFLVAGGVMIAVLSRLLVTLTRLQSLLTQLSTTTLPRTLVLADQASSIAATAQRAVETVDRQAVEAAPQIQRVIDRLDRAATNVATSSLAVRSTVEDTSSGLQSIRENPLTRPVLMGLGTVLTAGFIKMAFFDGRRGGKRKKRRS